MRKCPQCGEKVQDWFAACPKCRYLFAQGPRPGALGSVTPNTPQAGARSGVSMLPGPAKIDPLALVAVFASLFCGGIMGVPLGLLALRRIKDSGGQLGGRGYAVAAIGVGLFIFFAGFLVPLLVALAAE